MYSGKIAVPPGGGGIQNRNSTIARQKKTRTDKILVL
jgi:hypothetical protein